VRTDGLISKREQACSAVDLLRFSSIAIQDLMMGTRREMRQENKKECGGLGKHNWDETAITIFLLLEKLIR
jgi:hypothetical protein